MLLIVPAQGSLLDMSSQPVSTSKQALKEAQDHIKVLPEKSLEILIEHAQSAFALTPEDQVDWYLTLAAASRQTADLRNLYDSLKHLLALQHTENFRSQLPSVLNNLGVWFRRSGYFDQAKLVYMCSAEQAVDLKDKLRSMLSLAVVERNQNRYADALQLNHMILQVAEAHKLKTTIAIVENNLGFIHLNQGDLPMATEYFQSA